jgi:hypothetical protein
LAALPLPEMDLRIAQRQTHSCEREDSQLGAKKRAGVAGKAKYTCSLWRILVKNYLG